MLQKGENVRGAAQKFERSVSNEEEKKQQQQPAARWKRNIYPKLDNGANDSVIENVKGLSLSL